MVKLAVQQVEVGLAAYFGNTSPRLAAGEKHDRRRAIWRVLNRLAQP